MHRQMHRLVQREAGFLLEVLGEEGRKRLVQCVWEVLEHGPEHEIASENIEYISQRIQDKRRQWKPGWIRNKIYKTASYVRRQAMQAEA